VALNTLHPGFVVFDKRMNVSAAYYMTVKCNMQFLHQLY